MLSVERGICPILSLLHLVLYYIEILIIKISGLDIGSPIDHCDVIGHIDYTSSYMVGVHWNGTQSQTDF